MEDLILATRYSLMPNLLKLCGPSNFNKSIENHKKSEIKKELRNFESYYAYISLIGKKNSKSPFDEEVVEAYWIGNKLLEKVTENDLKKLILHKFTGKGKLNREKAEKLANSLPKGCVPHHSFHSLYIHSITGKLTPTIGNLNNCLIQLGRIKKIEGSSAIVAYKPLEFKNDLYSLGKKKERKVSLRVGKFSFIEKPKINDWVSIHWNLAIQILTKDETRRLEKYTLKNINAINQLNKSFK